MQNSDVSGQWSDVRCQMSAGILKLRVNILVPRIQLKAYCLMQNSDVGGQRSDVRCQMSDVSGNFKIKS